MENFANFEIRTAIAKKRLKHYEVAEVLGMHPTYFSHLLQTELPEEKKKKIMEAIKNYEL